MGNSFASDKLVRKKSINLKNEATLIFNFSVESDADIFLSDRDLSLTLIFF